MEAAVDFAAVAVSRSEMKRFAAGTQVVDFIHGRETGHFVGSFVFNCLASFSFRENRERRSGPIGRREAVCLGSEKQQQIAGRCVKKLSILLTLALPGCLAVMAALDAAIHAARLRCPSPGRIKALEATH